MQGQGIGAHLGVVQQLQRGKALVVGPLLPPLVPLHRRLHTLQLLLHQANRARVKSQPAVERSRVTVKGSRHPSNLTAAYNAQP